MLSPVHGYGFLPARSLSMGSRWLLGVCLAPHLGLRLSPTGAREEQKPRNAFVAQW